MPKSCTACGSENVIQAGECERCGRSFKPAAPERQWPTWLAAIAVFAVIGVGLNWAWNRSDGDGGEQSAVKACIAETADRGLTLDGIASKATRIGADWRLVGLLKDGRAYTCTVTETDGSWTVESLVFQG